ncbi:MAG: bacteriohemerythrin [Candidatus Loosdrechtia sp.]|uniref:bacteriohemerythrin n=1 Tax=Candidatus Loosdrechtia sp. TaxID=3101272 RepID=UPI003A723BA5|nr:MAG: bacteriohemerythrin [Candidatus Jettenia sp. AMX2]
MALIQWNDSLSVNVREFDRQHQKLMAIINELNDSMKQGKGKDVLGKIINELAGYAGTHFANEEKYFAQFGYPEANAHKKEHNEFVHKVSDFKGGFEKGKIGLSVEVMNFLCTWLRNHIKVVDKKYGSFFNGKGLK